MPIIQKINLIYTFYTYLDYTNNYDYINSNCLVFIDPKLIILFYFEDTNVEKKYCE